MREYLEPALKYLTKVIPHPSTMKVFMVQHKAFTYMAVASLLVIITSTLMLARHIIVADAKQNDTSESTRSTSLNATAGEEPQTVTGVHSSQQVTNTVSPDGETRTNLSVNGQQVELPQNGSVHKTIRTENGTTSLDVTVNGNSTSSNTSSISTNLHVMSDSMHINQNSEHRTP